MNFYLYRHWWAAGFAAIQPIAPAFFALTLMAITELPVRFAGEEISWCRHRLLNDRKKPQLHLSRYCQQPIDCGCPSPPCGSFAAAHVGCKEPPIERSEALRDAPVFGSSPFGGIFSQGARPDALAKMLPPKVWTFARVDQIRSRQRPLRPEKNCTRRRNELIAKGAMNTGE